MKQRPPEFDRELVRIMPLLRGWAYRRGIPIDHIDDLCQITLCRALEKWEHFEPGTNMMAWCCTILWHQRVSMVRHPKERLTDQMPIDDDGNEVVDIIGGAPAPQDEIVHFRELDKFVGELSEWQREILFFFGSGFSYEEIADLCQIELGTVRSRLFRAREAFRSMIDEHTRLDVAAQEAA